MNGVLCVFVPGVIVGAQNLRLKVHTAIFKMSAWVCVCLQSKAKPEHQEGTGFVQGDE